MSFQTGLSGLNASSRNLDVIGNNIANANTTGMKSSRAEFGNLVASSLGAGGGSNGPGIGVAVEAIAQQFTQGNISTTGNSLDVAINGGGFFQLTQSDGSAAYTRDGSFKLDKDGYIKTNSGANLMGLPTDIDGVPTSGTIQALKLPTSAPIGAKQTDVVRLRLNLDARATPAVGVAAVVGPPAVAAIQPTARSTYATSVNVYDSQGVASPISLYFEKDEAANTWNVFTTLDTTLQASPGGFVFQITFDTSGKILTPAAPTSSAVPVLNPLPAFGFELPAATIASLNPNEFVAGAPTDGFLDQPIMLDLGQSGNGDTTAVSQYGTNFAVADLTQDGYTAGELTSLSIGEDGLVSTRYSNGQTQSAGKITLADFRNVQGLSPLGGNAWAETFASGQPVQGSAATGRFGALRSGALEDSNVDLTAELVNMMTAQRAYQANAQTIKTQDQIMSTLVNLR
ncbi:MAG: flagellar hook protein FlgE [Comamonadaceae bacterium]|nr:flagellar hook protein FlgE [Comamonadaceae bacterium]